MQLFTQKGHWGKHQEIRKHDFQLHGSSPCLALSPQNPLAWPITGYMMLVTPILPSHIPALLALTLGMRRWPRVQTDIQPFDSEHPLHPGD